MGKAMKSLTQMRSKLMGYSTVAMPTEDLAGPDLAPDLDLDFETALVLVLVLALALALALGDFEGQC
jgi:hypothetical protein